MKPTLLPGLLMGALAVLCLVVALIGLYKTLQQTPWSTRRKNKVFAITAVSVTVWLVLVGALAASGWMAQFDVLPPRPLFVVFLPIVFLVYIAFTRGFTTLLQVVPPHWLVFFQSFRIVVELLLWRGFINGLVPVQMTFEGRNFDIIAGLLALVAGVLMMRHKTWAKRIGILYNLIGLALLLNIIIIAVLSMPTPFRYFMNEPANTIVATFPFVYLPAVLVVLAFGFHVFSLRQLLLKPAKMAAGNAVSQGDTTIAMQ